MRRAVLSSPVRGRSLDVPGQDLAFADVVRGADDAFHLHLLDQAGGAVVADLQMPLHKTGRGLALAAHQRHRLIVKTVARTDLVVAERIDGVARSLILGDLVDIVGLAAHL